VSCCCADGEPIPLDEAGNPLLGDIGIFLKKAIKAAIPDATLKYIDPTYMVQVRSSNVQGAIIGGCKIPKEEEAGLHGVHRRLRRNEHPNICTICWGLF
jgi:hypothetical protein